MLRVLYLVFQAFCAALTFTCAVSRVNGGNGGLDSDEVDMLGKLCRNGWVLW